MKVFKVPSDEGGGEKSFGAKYGPDAIQKQFERWPWRGAEDGSALPAVTFVDCRNPHADYYRYIRCLAEEERRSYVVLSGDNSVSFHTVKLVSEDHVEPPKFLSPNLVVLDAHPDACDEHHDLHARWVMDLWETGVVKPKKTFFFGIRDAEQAEMAYVKENGATVFSADDLYTREPQYVVFELKYSKKIDITSPLVIVVDIDVIDPSQAPATGVPRAPGLDTRQVLRIIREFGDLPFPAKVGEICEVIPAEGNRWRPPDDRRPDPAGLTVLAAEAILREMIRSFS